MQWFAKIFLRHQLSLQRFFSEHGHCKDASSECHCSCLNTHESVCERHINQSRRCSSTSPVHSLGTSRICVESWVAIYAGGKLILVTGVVMVTTTTAVEELEVWVCHRCVWYLKGTRLVASHGLWRGLPGCEEGLSHFVSVGGDGTHGSGWSDRAIRRVTADYDGTFTGILKTTETVLGAELTVEFENIVGIVRCVCLFRRRGRVNSIINPVFPVVESESVCIQFVLDLLVCGVLDDLHCLSARQGDGWSTHFDLIILMTSHSKVLLGFWGFGVY